MQPASARPPSRRDASLDPFTAERILSGTVPATDVSAAYREVVLELRAAAAPPRASERGGLSDAVAAYRSAHTARALEHHRRRRRRHTLAVSLGAALFLVAGGTAGAATGNLPDGAQRRVSDALAYVRISVPSGEHRPARDGPPITDPVPIEPGTPRPGGGGEPSGAAPTRSTSLPEAAPPDTPAPPVGGPMTPPANLTAPPASPTPPPAKPTDNGTTPPQGNGPGAAPAAGAPIAESSSDPLGGPPGTARSDNSAQNHPHGAPPGQAKKSTTEPGG